MLHHISITTFIGAIVIIAAVYYAAVAAIYYSKGIANWFRKRMGKRSSNLKNDELLEDKV